MLEFEQVKKIIDSEIDPRIKHSREMRKRLILHVDGIGLQDALERINGYENKAQFDAREKHAISNKFLTEELLRPVDNAFNARGGSKNYKFKSNSEKKEIEFILKLNNVKGSSSISKYIEEVWFHNFITDPNGLTFIEVKEDTESEDDKEAELTYKSIDCIRAYEQNGIFVDWVVFEPHFVVVEDDKEVKQFWAVDEKFYYLYEINDEGLRLVRDVENAFEKVPAILNSNIVDNITGWKKSAIDAQIGLLNKYLVSNSVLSIAEFLHNYPREWTYVDECARCNGSGNIYEEIRGEYRNAECNVCGGTGKAVKKDVTDRIELKFPEKDDVKIDKPSGYTHLPHEPWQMMVDSVDRVWGIIFFSHWGTAQEKSGNETATGRFIDVQPVNNRLDKYSKSIEQAQTELENFLGMFYFPESFEKAFIQYGRRYLIETPDQIWDKYLKAKKDNAPVSTLDLLLNQYLESEFRENEQMFKYEVKKSKLEPFVHWDINTVKGLGVKDIDYFKKLYFNEWCSTKEIKDVIDTSIEALNDELTTFAEEKISGLNNNQNTQDE